MEAAQIWMELAPHYFLVDCFANLEGNDSTIISGGLFWRQLRFGGNWLHIIFRQIVLEAAQIWRELAPHYFPTDCFWGSSNLEGSSSTLFSGRLFWRQLKFGGSWLHIIFWWIFFKIWRELAPHYFPADCFGGSSNLVGTGSTLFSDRLFCRQLKFGGNWLHIIFRQIVLEAAQIWRELAPHSFLTDCFGGSSNLEGTGSTLFSGGLIWKFGGNWLHIIFRWIALEAAQIWWESAPHYFSTDCFGGSSNLAGTGSKFFYERLFWRQLKFGGNWLHIIFWRIVLEIWIYKLTTYGENRSYHTGHSHQNGQRVISDLAGRCRLVTLENTHYVSTWKWIIVFLYYLN